MKCPECGYEQYCPCVSCRDRLPANKSPWKWIDGNLIQCAGCGLTKHVDWWEDLEVEQWSKNDEQG